MNEKILRILAAAAAAPSGDNSQPWRFVVRGNVIEFHYRPGLDHPVLNHEDGGTLIALGAALENAALEARALGFDPNIAYQENGSCVAEMMLAEGGSLDSADVPLHVAIPSRHSNRKAYKKVPLSSGHKAAILEPSLTQAGLTLSLVEEPEAMVAIGRALTTMEETALGHRRLHELFFADILWSDEDNEAGKTGLHIKTLELPPPAQVMFRLLKHWPVAKLLSAIGFPTKVAETNAVQNASTAAFGIISAVKTSRAVYLDIGRTLERVWLTATAHGLALQIVTGLTFLAMAVEHNPDVTALFSEGERERVRHAYATIRENAGGAGEPILVFRIGIADPPTLVSHRRAPEITFAD